MSRTLHMTPEQYRVYYERRGMEPPDKLGGTPVQRVATKVEKKQPELKSRYRSKAEEEYAAILEVRKRAGEIQDYWYEDWRGRIGVDCTMYKPDFLVWPVTGPLEFHEVKGGYIRRDGRTRYEAARSKWPCFKWVLAQKTKEGWEVK